MKSNFPLALVYSASLALSNLHAFGGVIQEGMDRLEDWHVEMESGAQGQIHSVSGQDGKAVQLDFDFSEGQWLQVWKRLELNLEDTQYIKLIFQATGPANGLQLKLVDQDGSTFGVNLEGALPSSSWTELELPLTQLTHFWGGDDRFDKGALRKIYVALTRGEGGKGTFILDSIQFSKGPTAKPATGSLKPFLDMDSSSGFSVGGEAGTSSQLDVIEGQAGKALRIQYDFGTGTWVQVQRLIQWNLKGFNHLTFWYRARGALNNLQVKLVDQDGSTFGATFEKMNPTEDWVQIRLPFYELNYFWGGDTQLDLASVRKFFFAVTKGEGGSGSIDLDDVQFSNIVLAQEKADLPKKRVEKICQCEGLDLRQTLDKALDRLNKTSRKELTYLENILLLLEVSLEKQDKNEVKRLLDLLFSETYIKGGMGSWPIWRPHESLYLSPSGEILHLIRLLERSRKIVGEEQASALAKKLLNGIHLLMKEDLLLPLAVFEGDSMRPAQDRRATLSDQDLAALFILSYWLDGKAEFLKSVEKILGMISKEASPFGLLPNEIQWTSEGMDLGQNPRQGEFYLVGQLKVVLGLSQYAHLVSEEKYSKLPRRLLKFLMRSYVAEGKIVASYDRMTGASLCNFESVVVYAQVVKLALLEGQVAFAETLIREKILPELGRDDSALWAWAYDPLQVILALLRYQATIASLGDDLKGLAQEVKARRFFDRPLDVIGLDPWVDTDAISELGKSEGNFDGVGFSFGATSFGPSHSFFKCLEKDAVFLVPVKEGRAFNAVQCMGQEVRLEPSRYETIHFLTSAHHGNISDFIELKYQDGSSKRLPFSVGDWWHKPKIGHIARACDLVQNGQKIRDRRVNLFHIEVHPEPDKILLSIVLPSNGKAVLFAVSAQRKEQS